ncbi:MAG: hypothetical protein WC645_02040 [Candidatus Margulisiibacteriota bacterium]
MQDIRISAANLARIRVEDRNILILNRNRLKKGQRVLTPFGGAIEFELSARPFLAGLGAAFEKGADLRLVIPQERLPVFERWFYLRQEREVSPFRELMEELVEEEAILPQLSTDQVAAQFLWTAKPPQGLTDRAGSEGVLTQRYLEIFEVTLVPGVHNQIIKALAAPEAKLMAVTQQEILAGQTADGKTEIGSVSKYLLQRE